MINTDIIHGVALIFAQRKGKDLQITDDLLKDMRNELMVLAQEYGEHDTYRFFKKETS